MSQVRNTSMYVVLLLFLQAKKMWENDKFNLVFVMLKLANEYKAIGTLHCTGNLHHKYSRSTLLISFTECRTIVLLHWHNLFQQHFFLHY